MVKMQYSQTRLISHLWDCQNCVILTEVDINRSYHSSPTRSNIKTTAKITAKNEHIIYNNSKFLCNIFLLSAGVNFFYNFYLYS